MTCCSIRRLCTRTADSDCFPRTAWHVWMLQVQWRYCSGGDFSDWDLWNLWASIRRLRGGWLVDWLFIRDAHLELRRTVKENAPGIRIYSPGDICTISHNHTTLILWINQKSDLTSLFVARNDGNWIGNILKQVNFTCNYNLHIYIHDIRPIFLGYVRGFALNFYGFIWYHTSSLGSWCSYSTQVYCKQTFFTIINHY